eukprot:m.127787 g.127787  ORF g.127787 m.127787 type:complete len:345 (-) comp16717_c0_seq2:904-1938(-)
MQAQQVVVASVVVLLVLYGIALVNTRKDTRRLQTPHLTVPKRLAKHNTLVGAGNDTSRSSPPSLPSHPIYVSPPSSPPPSSPPSPPPHIFSPLRGDQTATVECKHLKDTNLQSARCGLVAKKVYPLLVTCTPRSGSVFTHVILRKLGYDMANDWAPAGPGKDGVVSWIFGVRDAVGFGPEHLNGARFRAVVHQVREPLASVTSMCTEPMETREAPFLARHISIKGPGGRLGNALRFFVQWHEHLDRAGLYTYRFDDLRQALPAITRLAGLHPPTDEAIAQAISRTPTTNHRSHRTTVSWPELKRVDPVYAKRLWTLATRYGFQADYTYNSFEDIPTQTGPMPHC